MIRIVVLVVVVVLAVPVASVSAQSGFWYPSGSQCYSCPPAQYTCAPCAVAAGQTLPDPTPIHGDIPPVAPPAGIAPDPHAPPTPILPPAAQPSPSDLVDAGRSEEVAALLREIERLKQRNASVEQALEDIKASMQSQNETIDRQLESILRSVEKLKPSDEAPQAPRRRQR